jgi:flagellar hook assembly protein FlgD
MVGGAGGTKAAMPTAVSIGYTITASATTQVSILKNGHLVRTIEQGVSREAGDASLVWDLKNNQGANVPGDTYILQVEALDAQGHLARQVTPVIIVR